MTLDAIHNEHGERIDFTLGPAAPEAAPQPGIVVIGHGVTANKDRPWAQTLAATLQDAGFTTLRISFSGNGDSEGRFEDSTISKEVQDLGAVLDACERSLGESAHPVSYVGHSMGAAVGVLRAQRDPRIARIVSLGGMVHTQDFAQRKFGELTPGVDVMWDKEDCPLSQAYIDDLRSIDSVLAQASSIQRPLLLVHGEQDAVVPPSDARDILAAQEPGRAELRTIEEADHVFSGPTAQTMAALVRDWLLQLDRPN